MPVYRASSCSQFRIRQAHFRAVLWNLLILVWALVGVTSVAFAPELGLSDPQRVSAKNGRPPQSQPPGPVQSHPDAGTSAYRARDKYDRAAVFNVGPASGPVWIGGLEDHVGGSDYRTPPATSEVTGEVAYEPSRADGDPTTDGPWGQRPSQQHAVSESLRWLRDHQDEAGFWCPATFGQSTLRKRASRTGNLSSGGSKLADTGSPAARIETTSQVLLHFVSCGYDHKDGEFRMTCRLALGWLKEQCLEYGSIGDWRGESVRGQAWATMALAAVAESSGDPKVGRLAERALQHLLNARIPASGWGLRFQEGAADVISTALAREAIVACSEAGIELDPQIPLRDSRSFLWLMCQGEGPGLILRYSAAEADAPGHAGMILEAAWLASMRATDSVILESPTAIEIARRLTLPESVPKWAPGSVDVLYWWFGARALYRTGKAAFRVWNDVVPEMLRAQQRGFTADEQTTSAADLDEFGSWDVADSFGTRTGRVGSTAICGLTLSEQYRYARLLGE